MVAKSLLTYCVPVPTLAALHVSPDLPLTQNITGTAALMTHFVYQENELQ